MYFNKFNNFFHGIMFHHFHDNKDHLKGQGSISKDEFVKIIKFIGKKNILSANDFLNRLKEGKLKKTNVCLTFDDSLKCQFDVAAPIMEDFNLKGFFFVYTNIYEGNNPCLLEVYRFFRMNYFINVNLFYKEFYEYLKNVFPKVNLNKYLEDNKKSIISEKKKYKVHTYEDIEFRFLRTHLLSKDEYKKIMLLMFKDYKFKYKKELKKLFLKKKDLLNLKNNSHMIGLHSHSHPSKIESLSKKFQENEYKKNKNSLSKILGTRDIFSMSHPHGSYNSNILSTLKELNIKIGFDNSMKNKYTCGKVNNSPLEISREDHSTIMQRINN